MAFHRTQVSRRVSSELLQELADAVKKRRSARVTPHHRQQHGHHGQHIRTTDKHAIENENKQLRVGVLYRDGLQDHVGIICVQLQRGLERTTKIRGNDVYDFPPNITDGHASLDRAWQRQHFRIVVSKFLQLYTILQIHICAQPAASVFADVYVGVKTHLCNIYTCPCTSAGALKHL